MTDTTAPAAGERSRVDRLLPADSAVARALHVFVLSAVSIAQPLWALLAENSEFFVARRADRAEIVAVALLLLLVPPLVVVAVEALVGLVHKRAVAWVHAAAVAGFALLLFLRVLNRAVGDPALLTIGLALVAAVAATAYYLTTRGARRVLTAAGPLPLVFLAVFLLGSNVRGLVFAGEAAGAGSLTIAKKVPVVFLVLDEFPLRVLLDDKLDIDETRAPNLAAFAAEATWWRRATTVHEVSEMAVPAILTGIRSEKKNLPTAANFPTNLFSIFTAGGYDVRAAEVLTRLCTTTTCPGERAPTPPLKARVKSQLKDLGIVYGHQLVPPSLAARTLPDIGLTWGNFGGAEPPADEVGAGGVRRDIDQAQEPRLEAFLAGLGPRDRERPTLQYGHFLMPHAPYTHLPNGKPYAKNRSFIGIDMKTGFWADDEFVTDQAEQRLLLQLGYTDRQLGRIFDRLKQLGVYDDSLIVVASDHGATNRPNLNRRAFADASLGDVGSVPLMMKLPGQTQGVVSDANAETIDILPTVADVLDFTIPGQVTGSSLFAGERRPEKLMVNQFGREFRQPPDFPPLRESVDRMYGRFVRDGAHLNVFAIGPYKALVGKPWSGLPRGSTRLRATLDNPAFWTGTPPAGVSPAHQTGKVTGSREPVHLAVAVGDRIVTTARTFAVEGDAASLDVLVPDEALAPGHAEVRLFAVSGDAARPTLTPVTYG